MLYFQFSKILPVMIKLNFLILFWARYHFFWMNISFHGNAEIKCFNKKKCNKKSLKQLISNDWWFYLCILKIIRQDWLPNFVTSNCSFQKLFLEIAKFYWLELFKHVEWVRNLISKQFLTLKGFILLNQWGKTTRFWDLFLTPNIQTRVCMEKSSQGLSSQFNLD